MTVREFLSEYCKKRGWPSREQDLVEVLTDLGKIVHKQGQDIHRWYIHETVVTEIDGVFIEHIDFIVVGDTDISDLGLEYDLDNAKIVQKKTRMVTETYYE